MLRAMRARRMSMSTTHHHVLVQFQYLRRMTDALPFGELRYVYQSALVNAQIHEGTEIRYVVDDSGKYHPLAQVVDVGNRLVETE